MKKNLLLFFFSLIFSFIFVYLLVFVWVSTLEKYKDKNNFTNLEELNFHEKYSNQIHHLRGNNWPHHKRNILQTKEDFLFSTFAPFKEEQKNYLIQGDSWAEYMVTKDKVYESLMNIVREKDIGLINSGISSYSPSPMKVQYKILEEQYKIKPNYLIAIIDQTDIGDELCRYKHNIIEDKNGNVDYINREINTGAVMDVSKYYAFSKIILEKNNFINFHITNYYFYKAFNQIKTRIYNLKKFGFKNSGNYKCEFQQIQKYLFNLSNDDRNYFKKRIQEYINYLDSKPYLKKIFIVTFPHKKHLEKSYKINVSDIINELSLSKKFEHINFMELINNNKFDKDKIYEFNDPASHLNHEAHALYVKTIFKIIEKK